MKERQEDQINLRDVIIKIKTIGNYLRSQWFVILLVGLFGVAIGFSYSLFVKPTYTATLSFALEDEKSGGGGLSGALGLASSLGIDLGTSAGGAFSGANLIELMKSRTLIEKSLLDTILIGNKKSSLAEYYLEFSGLRKKMDKNEELKIIHFSANDDRTQFSIHKDSVLGEIYKKIAGINTNGLLSVIQKDKKISIINVEVESTDEIFSKSLVESLVNEVSDFYISTKSKKARTNVAILQRQADSIRNELNNAISGVAQAADNTFNLNSALNIKRVPSSHRQVDVQANTAILTQLVTNLEMAKVTLLKETPFIQIIDRPILPLKKEAVGIIKGIFLGWLLSSFLICFWFTSKRIMHFVIGENKEII